MERSPRRGQALSRLCARAARVDRTLLGRGGASGIHMARNPAWVNGVAGHYSEDEKRRAGIDSYAERAATKTRANSTLFLRNLGAKEERAATAERIFRDCPGYLGVRSVRTMTFVDFDSIKSSTNAMLRYQGHRPHPGHEGLVIDYDKDTGKASTRRAQQEAQVETQMAAARSADYFCTSCGTKALRTRGALLSELPCRGTDGASVVDEEGQLGELLLLPPPEGAPPRRVRRPNGVEKQLVLACRSCGAMVAYRSALAKSGGPRYLYVPQGTLSLTASRGAGPAVPPATAAGPAAPPREAEDERAAAPAPAGGGVDEESGGGAKRQRTDQS